MKKQNKQAGFTLIELMIVIAIVGVLAAVAMPMYKDYIVESEFTGMETAAFSYKTAVGECAARTGDVAGCDNGVYRIEEAIVSGDKVKFVSSLGVTDGVISVVSGDSDVGSLTLTPVVTKGVVRWDLTCNPTTNCPEVAAAVAP